MWNSQEDLKSQKGVILGEIGGFQILQIKCPENSYLPKWNVGKKKKKKPVHLFA